MKKQAGLYIHIPFCKSKCSYCDFASYPSREDSVDEYITAVIKESANYSDVCADTIFIGGGTPSLLSGVQFSRLMEGVFKNISPVPNAEFTIEANPDSLKRDNLSEYIKYGVNRVSMGLQASQEPVLKLLGRRHSFKCFLDAVNICHSCGIENINADMITGVPTQTPKDVRETALAICELPHVSVYSLKLEENTPLQAAVINGKYKAVSDETDRECFYEAAEVLRSHGHTRYEISNFSKNGHQCRHNLKYWRREPYIGLGVAAYSHYEERRFGNTRDIDQYIQNINFKGSAEIDSEDVSCDIQYERIMLMTRLSEGIDISEIPHIDDRLLTSGLAKVENNRLYLTDAGMDVQNSVVLSLTDNL